MSGLLQIVRRMWHTESWSSDASEPSLAIVDEYVNDANVNTRRNEPRQQQATYKTLRELRQQLDALESLGNLTVVLVLDASFCGHLSSLVERRLKTLGARLVLTVESGRLPGLETIGDLAMARGSLGWHEIVFERDASGAVMDARRTLRADERLVVFSPARAR